MKLILILILSLIGAFALTLVIKTHHPPDLPTPLSSILLPTPADSNYSPKIFGFLPYWTLNKFNSNNLKYLTDLAYFCVTVTQTGELNRQDLGYGRFIANYPLLHNLTQTHQLKFHLVIKAQNDQHLFNFLHSGSAQNNLFKELSNLNSQYPVDGYNIDFEPSSATDSATIDAFTNFVRSLHSAIKPTSQLTIDIYPSAASSPKLWDLPALVPYTDHFIVMTYDYTQASANFSGPIAPLYRPPGKRHAVVVNLKEISAVIPMPKIIVGLPLYGYQWDTKVNTQYAPVIAGSGSLATLGRIKTLIDSGAALAKKDIDTLSSRLILDNGHSYSQIYFEDSLTISEKVKMIKKGQFGGIALWALGYEGDYDVWSPINIHLKR